MAFHGEDDVVVDEAQVRAEKLMSVAQTRDQIIEEHKETPMKIAVAAVIGGWLIYRLLIK